KKFIERLRRSGFSERNRIECGEPDSDFQFWNRGADAFDDLAEESCSVLEGATVIAFSGVGAQELVSKVPMTMFDVDEIESDLERDLSRAVKVFDDFANLAVGEQRVIRKQSQSSVEDRMPIENPRLSTVFEVGPAVAAGMRELQTGD